MKNYFIKKIVRANDIVEALTKEPKAEIKEVWFVDEEYEEEDESPVQGFEYCGNGSARRHKKKG